VAAPGAPLAAQEASPAFEAICRPGPDADAYVPPRGEWERRSPESVGLDPAALDSAVAYTRAEENAGIGPDLATDLKKFVAGEPENTIVGPVKERGPVTGVVLKDGYLVREWGEPHRVDMTFSVTKSFLSSTASVAHRRGLIALDDRVIEQVPDSLFDTDHNRSITWDHLLRQTSDWRGELFGKPDWVDRYDGEIHEPDPPGEAWEYNDVRVNLLALSLLHVLRDPLQEVLREEVMDPVGASRTWRWHGYEGSWVTVEGQRMQTPSGGGHWGGGVWISARDQARFGLLTARCGRWGDRQVLTEEWVRRATAPTEANPSYGFMNWFLNTDREFVPSAPEHAVIHAGAGINRIFVDAQRNLVVVVRWIDGEAYDGFVERVLEAVE
jgi:CubicO group peptidase (beta-lactamase class C family)